MKRVKGILPRETRVKGDETRALGIKYIEYRRFFMIVPDVSPIVPVPHHLSITLTCSWLPSSVILCLIVVVFCC